jgi:hypothetical protein
MTQGLALVQSVALLKRAQLTPYIQFSRLVGSYKAKLNLKIPF